MTRSLIGTAWRRALGQKNWRRSVLGACVGLLIAALILLLTQLGLLDALEWLTLDARFIARYLVAPEPERSPVTVVAIDDRSVLEYGRWPWPRAVQAELFTAILNANPSVLGVDIIYSELDDAWADSRLARALGQGQAPVVLALARAGDRELVPDDTFLSPNVRVGHINTVVDGDGVVRRFAFEVNTAQGPVRAFSWIVASLASRAGEGGLKAPPLDASGRLLVNYRLAGSGGRLSVDSIAETVSAADVLAGRMRSRLAGRPVLVGVTAAGLETHDRHLTPLRPLGSIPGVYIHAAAVSSFLDGQYIHRTSPWMGALAALATGIIMGAAAFGLGPWKASGVFLGLVLASGGTALWRFTAAGTWVPVAPVSLTLIVTYAVGLWVTRQQAEREAQRIRETFRRYVAPEVVDILLEDPGIAETQGARREVTILFADVRGFTGYAEVERPEDVVLRLNRYLEIMTESVLLHGGMVDKFLGDGLMAVFGAPIPSEDHAEQAVRAGLHMLRRIELEKKVTSGRRERLEIGVGIHTGEAIIGSVGSWRRQEYTAIGDAVNVASRLQELAPPGTVVASEETMAQVGGGVAMQVTPLGATHLRGRAKPVELYQLTPGRSVIAARDLKDVDDLVPPDDPAAFE